MGFLTLVYQVSPMQGPWVQGLPLIACLPPACSLGSPLSTFLTTLIITPLGPACSRHLRSLAGRFVSPFPSLSRPLPPFSLSTSSLPPTPHCSVLTASPRLLPCPPLSFTLCLLPHNPSSSGSPRGGWGYKSQLEVLPSWTGKLSLPLETSSPGDQGRCQEGGQTLHQGGVCWLQFLPGHLQCVSSEPICSPCPPNDNPAVVTEPQLWIIGYAVA